MIIELIVACLLDRCLADPPWLPHPVVAFGHIIARSEHLFNKGRGRMLKGGILAVALIGATYGLCFGILLFLEIHAPVVCTISSSILIFYCLAGTTLIREVRLVSEAANRSTEEGRRQLSRIVGRDTSALSPHQIRTAALETLAENLSDGVIAPLFWYALLGLPGMMAYKMVNTLDSMIGYKTPRYLLFGRTAARIDDIANYIPARLTAFLMLLASGKPSLVRFVCQYGHRHSSPNAGYPEAALAGILNCRFGGTHTYFGVPVDKPHIGHNNRPLTGLDLQQAIRINRRVEYMMVAIVLIARL